MIDEIQRQLIGLSNAADGLFLQRFFKTGPGQYGEGDLRRSEAPQLPERHSPFEHGVLQGALKSIVGKGVDR